MQKGENVLCINLIFLDCKTYARALGRELTRSFHSASFVRVPGTAIPTYSAKSTAHMAVISAIEKALAQLREVEDVREIITMFFEGLITETKEDGEKKGCFLVNTALDLPNQSAEIQKIVTEALKEIEEFFIEIIEKAQKAGQLEKKINAKEKATSLVTLVVGLRVLARGTYEANSLEAIKTQALQLLEC